MSKGRTPPPGGPGIDHAANLRDRLGRAAYDAIPDDGAPQWDGLRESGREMWRTIGQAVLDTIVGSGDRKGDFSVSSIYGYKNQKPYVNVDVSVSPMQCSPAKAREIALMLLEAADASESDAVLIGYARDVLAMDMQAAGQLLSQFRQYREQQRGKVTGAA